MSTRDLADLGYRRIVILLVGLIVVPTALLLALGALLLFLGKGNLNLVMGILVLALSGAAPDRRGSPGPGAPGSRAAGAWRAARRRP